jgi:hypothetical protein
MEMFLMVNDTIMIHLGVSYIGVVCPSERSMMEKNGILSIIKEEKDFFSKNAAYSTIQHRCGILFLMESLNKVFYITI